MNNCKDAPEFSIILPTRGRNYYISNTIKSVIAQNYKDYELIIVDNNENDLTFQEIQKYPSTQIRYFKTGNLPMWENWNFGYQQSIGKYIIVLTDRSLLYSQDSLDYLHKLIRKTNYDIYTWPMIVAVERSDFTIDSQLLWGLGNKNDIVLTRNDYREFIVKGEWDKYGMSAPKGFNSCISRDLSSKIVSIYGSLYLPLNPDYSHSFMLLNSCENVLYLSQPLFISANLKDSYESKVRAFQSDKSFYEQYGITKEKSTEFCPVKSDITTGWNLIYNDLYKIMSIQGGLIDKDKIFTDAFLMSVLKYCQQYRYDDEDSTKIIEMAIKSYLDYMYPSCDPRFRKELSLTIKYIFYRNNLTSIPDNTNRNLLVRLKDKVKRQIKKCFWLLCLFPKKNKNVFSLFLKNSIQKNK